MLSTQELCPTLHLWLAKASRRIVRGRLWARGSEGSSPRSGVTFAHTKRHFEMTGENATRNGQDRRSFIDTTSWGFLTLFPDMAPCLQRVLGRTQIWPTKFYRSRPCILIRQVQEYPVPARSHFDHLRIYMCRRLRCWCQKSAGCTSCLFRRVRPHWQSLLAAGCTASA